VLVRPSDDDLERGIDSRQDESTRVPDLQRGAGVEDVGRGEPVVQPAAGLPERLRCGVDEGREIVLRPLLDLGHAFRRRGDGALADGGGILRRHDADLRPRIQGCQLDLEPAGELALLRPDELHGRSGVAGDHLAKSRAWAGYSSAVGRPGVPGYPPPCARIFAARIAAFRAPFSETHATGTPGGICAIESRASRPPMTLFEDVSGTPITGRSV
jgi:hypothetical protein